MELFLLLSIGMSIIVFISVALDEAPPTQSNLSPNFEPAFSLESNLLTSSGIHLLKLEEQMIRIGVEEESILVAAKAEPISNQSQVILATSEF